MFKKIVSSFLALCFFTMQSFLLLLSSQIAVAQTGSVVDAESASIVISAVQITGGVGKTSEDFIELYNASPAPVDLNGFRLVKRTATASTDASLKAWSSETIIQPHHFYLWANSSFAGITAAPDTTTSSTLADNNGIALRQGSNDTGIIYDSLAWGNTANGFENVSIINPGAGESLIRTGLADLNSVFSIQLSNPRNSSNEFIPEESPVDEPPVEEEPPVESEPINIKITEILPNPTGEDSGFEKIELFNAGTESVNLEGLQLDDVSNTESISSNSYTLSEMSIAPAEYLAITIPAGKFALNNTDGDVVTLFDQNNKALDTIFYEGTAPENQSYSNFSSGWQWAPLTFGQNNGEPPTPEEEENENEEDPEEESDYDNSGLIISEIFPQPEAKDTEFVEIYNSGAKTAQLSKVSIWVGIRHKLLPSVELEPGNYYVIEQAALPVQLRNSGQEVRLLEDTETLSTVTYPMAVKGASFAVFEDGFLWTTTVTKSAKNILQLPEDIKKKSETEALKTTVKKVDKKSDAAAKKTTAKSATIAKSAATNIAPKPAEVTANNSEINNQQALSSGSSNAQKTPLGKIIAMGAAAVSAGIIALYKLVFTAGVE
jgi:hypothetical protein